MKRLRNIHAGTILGIVAAIYIAFYLVQTVRNNYQLQQQISSQEHQIKDLQDNNSTLKYQIQYYNTDDYKEKVARAKLGLQAPGEGVVLLPQPPAGQAQPTTTSKTKSAPKRSNWQQWVDFLEGKGA